ncbi:hypothetical protein U9M48_043904 [Paspalum notatum var. saurae]|uniref:Uncharacterized protein n=1 Tax=Paspalum notatum var. saurae TaxID=547442 RepID=A0AAQ3UYE8_PASNO
MFTTTGARRLLVIRRTGAAAAAGGTNPLQPKPRPHAAHVPYHCCSSTPLASPADPDAASYLVASCGLSPAAAAALAQRGIRIASTDKADAVLNLLRRHGFSNVHIAKLLRVVPRLLMLDADKIIRPKLQFFDTLGVGAPALVQTNILVRSLDKCIVPRVESLRGIVGTGARLRAAISRKPRAFGWTNFEKRLRFAVEYLRRHGLSEEAISKLLSLDMGVLSMAPHRIAGIFEDIEALGLPITDSQLVRCFALMCSLKRDTIWRRLALYQSFGLSQSQVAKAFMIQPMIVGLTDGMIQSKLRFFQDELKIPLSQVIAMPKILGMSLEKNILPRCAVLNVLMREEKIQRDTNLLRPLGLSANRFSEIYIKKYGKDVPDVVRAYAGDIEFKGIMGQDSGC